MANDDKKDEEKKPDTSKKDESPKASKKEKKKKKKSPEKPSTPPPKLPPPPPPATRKRAPVDLNQIQVATGLKFQSKRQEATRKFFEGVKNVLKDTVEKAKSKKKDAPEGASS